MIQGERVAHQLTRGGKDRAAPATLRSVSLPVGDGDRHPLIHAKLGPPQSATTCIERPALLSRLDAGAQRKLTLLTGPVGSGKTTLLAQWYQRAHVRDAVAWLSLDELDNEPVRFLSCLSAAIKAVHPTFDAYIPRTPRVDEPLDAALVDLIAGLFRIEKPICIVLDNVQTLSTPALVRAIDTLLLHSPAGIRWILSGRGRPARPAGAD